MVLIRRSDYLSSYPRPCSDLRFRRFLAKELRARLAARSKLIIKEKQKADPQLDPRPRRRWWKTSASSLLHRSSTLHDKSDDETDSSGKKGRVQPHMIRRTDEKPRPINPSGWISQGRMPTVQAGLLESTRPKSSIGEQPAADPTVSQSPEPVHSQTSGQQSDDLDAESGSELEELSEIPRRGRRNQPISDSGTSPHRKFVLS